MSILYAETFMLIYLGNFLPFTSKELNVLELFNEITILVVGYHLLTFSPLVPEAEVRYKMGFVCSGVVLLNVAVNLTMLVKTRIASICLKIKQRAILKRQKVL